MSQAETAFWPGYVAAAGAVLVIVALILHFIRFSIAQSASGSISYWHGVCTSAVGQYAQVADQALQGRCSEIGLAEHAMGWSLVLGLLAVVAGVVAAITLHQRR